MINGAITETESIKCNKGEAGALWNPDSLTTVPPRLTLSIREAERDSYYDLIGATESYWRAFQTNGTPAYHRARLAADSDRIENGVPFSPSTRRPALRSGARKPFLDHSS